MAIQVECLLKRLHISVFCFLIEIMFYCMFIVLCKILGSSRVYLFQKGVTKIPSYKFLPLMYQLAARMGSKISGGLSSEDVGFHTVLNKVT